MVGHGVARLLALGPLRRETGGAVLGPGKGVDPRRLCDRRVFAGVDRGVDERCRPPPVLVGRVRIEDLRVVLGLLEGEDAVVRPGLEVGLRKVGKREDVSRVEEVDEGVGVARRLGEAMVEAAAAASRDVSDDAIEHLAAGLVLVEAVEQERPEESSALRDPERQGVIDGALGNRERVERAVLQTRDEVADAGGPEPDELRVLGDVDDLIDAVRLEAAFRDRRVSGRGSPSPFSTRAKRHFARGIVSGSPSTVSRTVRTFSAASGSATG